MDIIEMTVIAEIANEEIRDYLLKAYRKQIPEKIIAEEHPEENYTIYLCPKCKHEAQEQNFCDNCGQALTE